MLSVIIHDNGEPNVVKYTYEDLFSELKDIQGSELIVATDWFEALKHVKNSYVCLVEADCLVTPGYFQKQLDGLVKAPLRKIAMLSPVVGVNHWDNKFYGYRVGGPYTDAVMPVTKRKSTGLYPVQIGYLPGSIIRIKMLKEALQMLEARSSWQNDLVFLSAQLSMAFWHQSIGGASGQNGNPVYLNPSVTYITTEDYVNDIGHFDLQTMDIMTKFIKESI